MIIQMMLQITLNNRDEVEWLSELPGFMPKSWPEMVALA